MVNKLHQRRSKRYKEEARIDEARDIIKT